MSAGAHTAIVTGASSGIGAQVARRLVGRGYHLVLIARRKQRLEALAEQIDAPCTVHAVDLADGDALEQATQRILAEHNHIDVLVNNAGYGRYRPFLNVTRGEAQDLLQVNYVAAAALTRAVLPGMLAQRGGCVINVASVAAKMGPWGHAGYAAAKAAMRAMTQSLACEYGDRGVHFSCVMPGLVKTEFFNESAYSELFLRHKRRALTAEYVAERIVRLLDKPRLEMTIPSAFRVMDWIATLSPSLAHQIVARTSRPPAPELKATADPAAARLGVEGSPSASTGP